MSKKTIYLDDAIDAVGSMLRRKFGIGGDLAEITLSGLPSAQPESQWIPCSERLPENNCQCIATAKVKHVDGYPDYEVDTADYTDGIFTTANSWWGIESIIAWMPLPEGYRGEQDE